MNKIEILINSILKEAESHTQEEIKKDISIVQKAIAVLKQKIPKSEKKRYSKDSIEHLLSIYLFEKIREHCPNHKIPNFQQWALRIDRMIRLDKRNPQQIIEVIDWCQQDEFWCRNILSTGKLRIHYDKLMMYVLDIKPKINGNKLAGKDYALTKKIAVAYSSKFMTGSEVDEDSQLFKSLIKCAKKMQEFSEKIEHVNIDTVIKIFMNCLRREYADSGKTIYPKMLYSDNTWTILFPQYIANQMPSIQSLMTAQ